MPGNSNALLTAIGCVLVVACTEPADRQAGLPAAPDPQPLTQPERPLFADRTQAAGLRFVHYSGTTGSFLFPEILGSGVALLDYDLDGDLDVYLVQGRQLDDAQDESEALFPLPSGQPPGNRLFRNELIPDGALRFTDVTDSAAAGSDDYGMGVATGDIDNDGDPDLYLTNLAHDRLLRNNGDGTFADATQALGVTAPGWSTSAAFCDFDRDGDLDLYVAAYTLYSVAADQKCTSASGNRDYCGPQNYQNAQDRLLRNDGESGFVDVSVASGIAAVRGPGLGVTCADFDGDGWPDVFVANDGEANYTWFNRGGLRFEETGLMAGTAYNRDGAAEASMGVSAGDFDGDGDEDLFMTHLVNETNTLYANDGSGSFTDVTDRAGLGFGSKARTGFGAGWFDYDNDGWLDLYIANGDVKVEELRASESRYPFDQPNQLYRNLGAGRFEEIGAPGAGATRESEISRGVAFGDIDNDGDIDFVVSNNSGPARLYLTIDGNAGNWLRLRLVGSESNRDAYGARVAVFASDGRILWRRVHSDGSYLSASDARLLVGLGTAARVERVAVIWPNGRREMFAGAMAGDSLVLREGGGGAWAE